MIIAFIADDLLANAPLSDPKRKALEEVKMACKRAAACLNIVPYDGVAQGKADYLDPVYNSDMLIVDLSDKTQQGVLLYHLGVRENMKLFDNVVLVAFSSGKSMEDITCSLEKSTKLVPYTLTQGGDLVTLDVSAIQSDIWEDICLKEMLCIGRPLLSEEIYVILCETGSSNRAPIKEKFLSDLRSDRERFTGEELRQRLHVMRRRLDDPELLSADIVLNLLLAYRDCEDFSAMVKLIDDVRSLHLQPCITDSPMFTYLYAFALNGRKRPGDRDKALQVITGLLKTCKKPSADAYGLLGRIHKDRFLESNYENQEALKAAVDSYGQGFHADPNEYLGVNLATLLVCSGHKIDSSLQLRQIFNQLSLLVGRKGDLSTLTDYWDLATLFEIRVLSEQYSSAVAVLDRILNRDPPAWQLSSTVRNIKLICHFRKPSATNRRTQQARQLFDFWMEFVSDVDVSDKNDVKSNELNGGPNVYRTEFPVLVMRTPSDRWEPAFLQLNIEDEPKFLRVSFYNREDQNLTQLGPADTPEEEGICMLEACLPQDEDHVFHVDDIKGISLAKRYPRRAYLFTVYYSYDYTLKFSCESVRMQFYSVVCDQLLSSDQLGELILEEETQAPLEFEYENDRREILGRGAYGTVYVGRDLATQRKIAIKEIQTSERSHHQQMIEEIRLHSRLHHENIVRYLGAVVDGGVFKILMELVPGGSLTSLLKKLGNLKEKTVSNYSMDILEGLQYLHKHRIIHRDVKADNILIDQYTGRVKLSDFGLSKRLGGLEACAMSFKGTCQYMAPELIKNQKGYDFPIDIWSFGCTVVQMLTGSPPFKEFENPMAALFRVGSIAEHPAIPDSVTPECRDFVLRTFTPNPAERAKADELLVHRFIEQFRRPKRKHARLPATYGHGPVRRSPLGPPHGPVYERFLSALPASNTSNHSTSMIAPKSADMHSGFRLTVEQMASGFVSPLSSQELKPTAFITTTRSSSVPTDLDLENADVKCPAVGTKRDRLMTETHKLPPLNLSSLVSESADEKHDSMSSKGRTASVTPYTSSGTPDAFTFVKREKESKSLFCGALEAQRKIILSIWHQNLVTSGARLPLSSQSPGAMLHRPPNTPVTPDSSSDHSSEMELLECLFDMLLHHLRGGTVWNDMAKYVTVRAPTQTDRVDRAYDAANTSSELGDRFADIIRRLTERVYRDDVPLFPSSWLFSFLNLALTKMWSSFEKPLYSQLECPHELFAWTKFIRDAIASAMDQLASVNAYADLHVTEPRKGSYPVGRVAMRRNRSQVYRVPFTASQREFSYMSRADAPHSTKPSERARPISLNYGPNHQLDGLTTFTKDTNAMQNKPANQEQPVRRRISFRPIGMDNTRNKPAIKEETIEEIDQEQLDPHGHRESTSEIPLEDSIEEASSLKRKLTGLMHEFNELLRTTIHQKECELQQLRQLAPEVSLHDVELTTGYSNVWEWFTSMQLSQNDLNTLLDNVNNESDFLSVVTKDDLYRMNLTFSAVMRVWRAVVRIRESHRNMLLSQL